MTLDRNRCGRIAVATVLLLGATALAGCSPVRGAAGSGAPAATTVSGPATAPAGTPASAPSTAAASVDQQVSQIDSQLQQIDQQNGSAASGLSTSEGDPTR